MQKYYSFIDEYTKLLNDLEIVIKTKNISEESASSKLEKYRTEIFKTKEEFCLKYMRSWLGIIDNGDQVNRIDNDFGYLLTKCRDLETEILHLK